MSRGAYHQEQRVAHESAPAESCVPLQPVRSGAQVHAHDVCHREDDNARERRRIQHHPHLRIMQPYFTPSSLLIPRCENEARNAGSHACTLQLVCRRTLPLGRKNM